MATNVIGMKTDAKAAQQEGLKTCPRCGATTFTDMGICYGCLFDFLEGSSDEMRVNVPQMFVDNLRHEAESRATGGEGDAAATGVSANDAPSLYAEEPEPWGSLDELWDGPDSPEGDEATVSHGATTREVSTEEVMASDSHEAGAMEAKADMPGAEPGTSSAEGNATGSKAGTQVVEAAVSAAGTGAFRAESNSNAASRPRIRVIAPDLPIEIEVMGSNVTVRQITAAED